MRKIMLSLVLALSVIFAATSAFAATVTGASQATVTVGQEFSAEFFNDSSVLYPTGGPVTWTGVDPTSNLVKADGDHTDASDVGLVCKSNIGDTWYVKIHETSATLDGKLKFYLPIPVNRNTGGDADGSLAYTTPADGEDWPVIPGSADVVYTSGANDTISTPFGTLLAFTFAVNPEGLAAGSSHSATITYTMTTTL